MGPIDDRFADRDRGRRLGGAAQTTAPPPSDPRDGSYNEQIVQLERNINNATELLESLANRLTPVLRPESRPGTPGTEAATKVTQQGSPLADHTRMLNYRLNAINSQLLLLLERLDF